MIEYNKGFHESKDLILQLFKDRYVNFVIARHVLFLDQLTLKRLFRLFISNILFTNSPQLDSLFLEPVYCSLSSETGFQLSKYCKSSWSVSLDTVENPVGFKFCLNSLPNLYHISTSTVYIQTALPQWLIELNFDFEIINPQLIGSSICIYLNPKSYWLSASAYWFSTQFCTRIDNLSKVSISLFAVSSQNFLSFIHNKTNPIYLSLCLLINDNLMYNIYLSSPVLISCLDHLRSNSYTLPIIHNYGNNNTFLPTNKLTSKCSSLLALLFNFHKCWLINEKQSIDKVFNYVQSKLDSLVLYDLCGLFDLDGIVMVKHEVYGAICFRIWLSTLKNSQMIGIWTCSSLALDILSQIFTDTPHSLSFTPTTEFMDEENTPFNRLDALINRVVEEIDRLQSICKDLIETTMQKQIPKVETYIKDVRDLELAYRLGEWREKVQSADKLTLSNVSADEEYARLAHATNLALARVCARSDVG